MNGGCYTCTHRAWCQWKGHDNARGNGVAVVAGLPYAIRMARSYLRCKLTRHARDAKFICDEGCQVPQKGVVSKVSDVHHGLRDKARECGGAITLLRCHEGDLADASSLLLSIFDLKVLARYPPTSTWDAGMLEVWV